MMKNEKVLNAVSDEDLENVTGGARRPLIKDKDILSVTRPLLNNLESNGVFRSDDLADENNLFNGRPSPKSKTSHKNNL